MSLKIPHVQQNFRKLKVKTFENRKSGLSEIEKQDFRKSKCNYNNINNTDINYIYPINQDNYNIQNSDTQTEEEWIDRYTKTVDEIKKQNLKYACLHILVKFRELKIQKHIG